MFNAVDAAAAAAANDKATVLAAAAAGKHLNNSSTQQPRLIKLGRKTASKSACTNTLNYTVVDVE